MKKLLVLVVLLGMAFSVTSCNTFRGAGEDIEDAADATGDAMSDVID